MKRGIVAIDFFYLIIAFGFIYAGVWAMFSLFAAYSLEEPHEGVGFRQAAVINTYGHMDDFMFYTDLVAKYASQEALHAFQEEGLQQLFTVENEESPCGTIGTYAAWNYEEENCFTSIVLNPVEGALKESLDTALNVWWHHPFVQRVAYEYALEQTADGLRVVGTAQEEIILPVVNAKDDAISAAAVALVDSTVSTTALSVSSPLVTATAPDSDRKARAQPPTHIVLHYTAGGSASGARAAFLNGPLSIHYIVDKPDGSGGVGIIQMISEDEVAQHAGCSGEGCLMSGMNDVSIGIEIVNRGFKNKINEDAKLVENVCEEGYTHTPFEGHDCWETYPDKQLDVLYSLVADIATRWDIPVENIIGHDEIKEEKSDPGPVFPWSSLRSEVTRRMGEPLPPPVVAGGIMFAAPTQEESVCTETTITSSGDVYVVAEGIVREVCADCDIPFVVIRHGQELLTRYEGLTPQVAQGDAVLARTRIGTGDAWGFSVMYKDKQAPPSCFFDTASLAKTGCAVAESCVDIGFRGLQKNSCFSTAVPLEEVTSDTQARLVLQTQRNIESYEKADVYAIIKESAEGNQLPDRFLEAIITQESKGEWDAQSGTGALGIMQFVVGTAGDYNLRTTPCGSNNACTVHNDDRLDPVKAIPAGAEHLKFLLDRPYINNDLYLAAQAYNSGQGNVQKAVDACGPNYECIRAFFIQLNRDWAAEGNNCGNALHCRYDAEYGRKVLGHMAAWGGYIPGTTGDVSCEGTTIKGVGTLRFKPHFSVLVNDVISPIGKLINWTEQKLGSTHDNLQQEIVDRSPPGWTVQEGFCAADGPDTLLQEITLNIEECDGNGQLNCGCPLLPEETTLPEGDFYSITIANGLAKLSIGDTPLSSRVFDAPMQWGSLENPEGTNDIEISFRVIDGKIIDPIISIDGFPTDITNIYKSNRMWGFLDEEHAMCFSTMRHRVFCAESHETLVIEEEPVHPVVRFGMHFTDEKDPDQPTITSLTGETILANPKLSATFEASRSEDVSGVYVYCRSSLDSFTVRLPVPDLHLYPEDIERGSFELKTCNGKPVATLPDISYTVWIHSFDYGANENEEYRACGNAETITYQTIYPGPPPVYEWVSECGV